MAAEYELPISCIRHDFRSPLPAEMQHMFDVAVMDPPYTVTGTKLFLNRGVSALKEESNMTIFLSVAHKNPLFQIAIQKEIVDLKCFVVEILSKFNQYDGAQILGGVSDMYVIHTTKMSHPYMKQVYDGPLYTGDFRKTKREYRCVSCRQCYTVGTGQQIKTIEELKQKGCKACGKDKFRLLKKQESR